MSPPHLRYPPPPFAFVRIHPIIPSGFLAANFGTDICHGTAATHPYPPSALPPTPASSPTTIPDPQPAALLTASLLLHTSPPPQINFHRAQPSPPAPNSSLAKENKIKKYIPPPASPTPTAPSAPHCPIRSPTATTPSPVHASSIRSLLESRHRCICSPIDISSALIGSVSVRVSLCVRVCVCLRFWSCFRA